MKAAIGFMCGAATVCILGWLWLSHVLSAVPDVREPLPPTVPVVEGDGLHGLSELQLANLLSSTDADVRRSVYWELGRIWREQINSEQPTAAPSNRVFKKLKESVERETNSQLILVGAGMMVLAPRSAAEYMEAEKALTKLEQSNQDTFVKLVLPRNLWAVLDE
jgi:hypothetical protein